MLLFVQKSEDASIFSEEGAQSLEDLTEEEEEEETVTEVAVSEKTLKFKISTERLVARLLLRKGGWERPCIFAFQQLSFHFNARSSGIRSHPGSRKGSREKAQDMEIARSYRYERSNRTSDSGADKRSWSSSENTSSYEDRR